MMRAPLKNSFSTKLTIYILSVCTVIFLVIFIILYVMPKISQHKNVIMYSELIADQAENQIIEQGRVIERINSILTLDPVKSLLLAGDQGTFESILKNSPEICGCAMEYAPGYKDHDVFAYKHKKQIHFRKLPHGTINFSPERLDKDAFAKRISFWSGYYYSFSYIKQRVFSRFEPMYDSKNQFVGYLRLDIFLEKFTDFVNHLSLYKTGYAYLMTKNGILISHPNQEIQMYSDIRKYAEVKNIDYEKILKRATQEKSGSGEISVDNIRFFVYFRQMKYTKWVLVVLCPHHEVYDSIARVNDLILLCCISCLILLFWVVIRVIKRLFYPLKQFSAVTRTIADGNFNDPIPMIGNKDEIQELRESFVYMQKKIVESIEDLKINTIEKEKIEGEMRVAQRIQERFLPSVPKISRFHFSLHALLEQSKAVGGDMYSYFVKRNCLYFVVGDVRGKGIPAALYMASVVTLFNYLAPRKRTSSDICNTINNYMSDNVEDDMFITMFVGILDLKNGMLSYSNAGHPFPILCKKENLEVNFLENSLEIPIGVMRTMYKESRYQMSSGDMLFIYTDGLTEAQNKEHHFYGKERIKEVITANRCENPEQIIQTVLADLKTYTENSREDADDLTMLAVQYQ